jgi:hypothetical protein
MDGASALAAQERQVLARERALESAAAGGSVRTTYTYATGPDGRRYIVGAEVSIVGDEDVMNAVPGGTRTGRSVGTKLSTRTPEESGARGVHSGDENESVKNAIQELEEIEGEVIAHEAAHKAAAGRFGGPVSYTYTTGPDGKRYITGGEVPINTPSTSDPEEALRNATQVMKAAMAPGDPSGQDIAVAASAAQIAASARARIASGDTDGDSRQRDIAVTGKKAADAYLSLLSPKGLWTAAEG